MPEPSERRQVRRYPIQLPILHTTKGPASTNAGVAWARGPTLVLHFMQPEEGGR